MHLVVGLGNPGLKYEQTRHNIGFMALDYFADKAGVSFSDSKWEAKVAKVSIGPEQLILTKPETFMNCSGRAVGKICTYYKIVTEKVIVIHDDLDLDLGRIKLVVNRGAGGHNGISSIIQCLGGKNFPRIRAGIGRPDSNSEMPVSSYVLSRFTQAEQEVVDPLLVTISESLELVVKHGTTYAMNHLNRL
nr:aminoacyl-tRNA hydrolase [Desulfobulbaceae bacterium]